MSERDLALAYPRLRKIAAALGVAAALLPNVVLAAVGTGIGASPIALAGDARPGHTYRLPSVYVVNTGDQPATYLLKVQRLVPGPGRSVPAGWVLIARDSLALRPAESATVALVLRVPAGAAVGAYESDIVAAAFAVGVAGGTSIGAAAATRLSFTVSVDSGRPEPFDPRRALPPWLLTSSAVAGFVALGGLTWSRLGLRIEVRRR
jgi:hypothetical protein